MRVTSIEQISNEVIKITSDEESAFFIRTVYLSLVNPCFIVENAEFINAEEEDLLNAGLCYAAELKAMDYLARCEQSRLGLLKKLQDKGFEKSFILKALDYLEQKNYLSDRRFARAWLNSRHINHYEGRTRLKGELAFRGISKEIIEDSLNEFFAENDERELCFKAFEKVKKSCAEKEKIIRKLMALGFSYGMIKSVIEENI